MVVFEVVVTMGMDGDRMESEVGLVLIDKQCVGSGVGSLLSFIKVMCSFIGLQ